MIYFQSSYELTIDAIGMSEFFDSTNFLALSNDGFDHDEVKYVIHFHGFPAWHLIPKRPLVIERFVLAKGLNS